MRNLTCVALAYTLGLAVGVGANFARADDPYSAGSLPYYNRAYHAPGQGYTQFGSAGGWSSSYSTGGWNSPAYGGYGYGYAPYSSTTFLPGGFGSYVPPAYQFNRPFSANLGGGPGAEPFAPVPPVFGGPLGPQPQTESYRLRGAARLGREQPLAIPPSPLSPVNNSYGEIRIRLPEGEHGPATYVLNGTTYTIRPGEAQVFAADRTWTLRMGSSSATSGPDYALTAGTYKLLFREGRWDLYRARDSKKSM